MNKPLLLSLIMIIFTSNSYANFDAFLNGIDKSRHCLGSACNVIFEAANTFFNAKETSKQLEKSEAKVEKLENTVDKQQKELIANSESFKKIAEKTTEQVTTQKETNSILKDGFDRMTKPETIKTIQNAATIGMSAVIITKSGYDFVHWARSSWWPSKAEIIEKATKEREIELKLKFLEAQMELYPCLVNNAENEKDAEGMPIKCKDQLLAFGKAAGFEHLKREKEAFLNR